MPLAAIPALASFPLSSTSPHTTSSTASLTWCRQLSMAVVAIACTLTTVSAPLSAQDLLARELLVQMSRNQSTQLCGFKSFTECMEFTKEECLALSEQAIQQCLMPLPEKINPSELENDSIEACPKKVYEDAGYSDEKAKACLQESTNK